MNKLFKKDKKVWISILVTILLVVSITGFFVYRYVSNINESSYVTEAKSIYTIIHQKHIDCFEKSSVNYADLVVEANRATGLNISSIQPTQAATLNEDGSYTEGKGPYVVKFVSSDKTNITAKITNNGAVTISKGF